MVEKSHTAGEDSASWYTTGLRPFQNLKQRIADFFAPSADAAATGDVYEINIELPGVALADIQIDVHDGILSVQGEKRAEREEKGRTYFFSERTFGAFQRSFRLPPNVDADQIAANFKDGLLTIRIPKAGPPPDKTRRVEIKTG